jgi:hypothetical protein
VIPAYSPLLRLADIVGEPAAVRAHTSVEEALAAFGTRASEQLH